MIVIVSGYRFCDDRHFVHAKLDEIQYLLTANDMPITKVVQGGARGVDNHAKTWAKLRGIDCEEERAEWGIYGMKAGPIRNSRMLQKYDISLVIAFVHSKSKGTKDMIRQAHHRGIEHKQIPLDRKAWNEIYGNTEDPKDAPTI